MTLAELNQVNTASRIAALTNCCGATVWVKKMNDLFPIADQATLLAEAERIWFQCSQQDWLEAFTHHPKIGDLHSLKQKFAATSAWAAGEQVSVADSTAAVLEALADGNTVYENKFGYIFIVCATGKSAPEMLDLLLRRVENTPEQEIHIAMHEQNKITALRLQKLLAV